MNPPPDTHSMDQESQSDKAVAYFEEHTEGLYMSGWNPDHIHWGLFEPDECPAYNEKLANSKGLARALVRMVEAIVEPANIQARHHVVDAGCGVGGTAIHLAKTRRCRVTGINLTPAQLELAAEKASNEEVADRVSFERADCSKSLPFADGSVDAVVNIESACHYDNRDRFLREVSRILKPSGKLAASDWMVPDGLGREKYARWVSPMCEAWALSSALESPSTYREKLRSAGFEVMEFADFDGKDADNLRLLEDGHRLLAVARFYGFEFPGKEKLIDQIRTLRDAWRNGSYELNRYYAVKRPSA
ncbi:MAG: methyltransferase domain-containing protein [Gammaproteobacteria bacterium]|nr:methyltransferase domain-containing protein [Gammaproteobacteria bacterium]MCY4341743.1 methyltransferase domain-containing protein [Gammaproteobacteria bacterium]